MHGADHQKGTLEVHLEEEAPYRLELLIAMDNYGLLVQQARLSCFFFTLWFIVREASGVLMFVKQDVEIVLINMDSRNT